MLPTFGPPSHAAVPHQAGSEAPQLQAALPQHGCGHGGQQLVVEDPWHSAAGSCRKVGEPMGFKHDLSMIYGNRWKKSDVTGKKNIVISL
jgi:hypothetical protein